MRAVLAGEGRRRLAEGLSLAERGRFAAAERALQGALDVDDSLDSAWAALGLCALLRGDLPQARDTWRRAVAISPSSPAADWLASLDEGALRRAVSEYNTAIELAHSGAYDEALGRIRNVQAALPGFLPALRLEGLLHAARGCTPTDYAAWCARASAWANDPEIAGLRSRLATGPAERPEDRLEAVGRRAPTPRSIALRAAGVAAGLAVVAGVAGFLAGRAIVPAPTTSGVQRVAAAPVVQAVQSPRATTTGGEVGAAELRAALDAAVRGDRLTLAALIDSAGTKGSGWTEDGRRRAQALLGERAVLEYATGRRSLRQLDTLAAIIHFVNAAHDEGAYVADDALYALMLLQMNRDNTGDARTVARELLRRFPTSMFANSRTRRIAAMSDTAVVQ